MSASPPRLWIERFAVVRAQQPELVFIRDLRMRRGLNLVWATEPAISASGAAASAGHGVGKTTFCLMLRSLLGDEGQAVMAMRDMLARTFLDGGVAAELQLAGKRFAVFRPFAEGGWAAANRSIEQLFEGERELSFADYLGECESRLCRRMAVRGMPTGQSIAWKHMLCWLTRDQSSRLRHYFDWRSDEGTGLQRRRKDPPLLMRAVLGVVSTEESEAERAVIEASAQIASSSERSLLEARRADAAREVLEQALRKWTGASATQPMLSEDLFEASVRGELQRLSEVMLHDGETLKTQIQALESERTELAIRTALHDADLRSPSCEACRPKIPASPLPIEWQSWQQRILQIDRERSALQQRMARAQRKLGEVDSLEAMLQQWCDGQNQGVMAKLPGARHDLANAEVTLQRAEQRLALERIRLGTQVEALSSRFRTLAEVFGLQGRYLPEDADRPFQLVDANGEAYTVLEILLGDLACALAKEQVGNQHPGLLVLDCPREADMSPHIYHQFISMLATPAFAATQVILTTTSPPPEHTQGEQHCILRLHRGSEEGLLLKANISR